VLADYLNQPEEQRLAKLFARFSSQIQSQLQVTQ
jgi:hypothetical protein